MLEEVLRNLNNWFVVADGVHTGEFTVEDGGVTLPFLQTGQYFRVLGSVFNDGLYQYPAEDMTTETFDGAIWALAIPKAVITMADEIAAWQKKNGESASSPFLSESFGGYSYSKGTASGGTAAATTWQGAFRSRLNQWRKL